MCILLLSFRQYQKYPLIVAANREEVYDRPASAAAFWDDAPDVLAGRDLLQGGTWLGITRQGRFAALTNFRDLESNRPDRPSRGRLVSDFLTSDEAPDTYLSHVAERANQYNGFSLIVGYRDEFLYYSNREYRVHALSPGLYGLSNHLLDTPWPKVVRGRQAIGELLAASSDPSREALFAMLADRVVANDADLPNTGIGHERERLLSPLFVAGTDYGTRSSTVILIDNEGTVNFVERTFQRDPDSYTTVTHTFRLRSGEDR